MEFDNSFEVPLPPAQAWAVLTDIRRIAPCMPGAELTDVVDDHTYKGRIAVRLGPVALAFAGTVRFEEMDAATRAARVKAQGSDAKGRGGANAAASFRLEPAGAGTKVLVHTDLSLSGSVAQYGRGVGMIQATAGQIMAQFAANLRAQLAREHDSAGAAAAAAGASGAASGADAGAAATQPNGSGSTAAGPGASPAMPGDAQASQGPAATPVVPPAPPPPAKPISGLTLMATVLWQMIRRLFAGRPHSH